MSQGDRAGGVGRWDVRSCVLVLLLGGCGTYNLAADAGADAGVELDLASPADEATSADMVMYGHDDGGICVLSGGDCTSGLNSGAGNTCCRGECVAINGAVHLCMDCGTAGLPCCAGFPACETDRDGQRATCVAGTCDPCGAIGQDCCGGNVCGGGEACATCGAGQDGGTLTKCEPSNCGTLGASCCYDWTAIICGIAPPNRTCMVGLCKADANDPTGYSCQ